MTQGFKDDKGNFRPTGGSKGSVSEKDLNISVKGNNDTIKVDTKSMKSSEEKKPKLTAMQKDVLSKLENKDSVLTESEVNYIKSSLNGSFQGSGKDNSFGEKLNDLVWNNEDHFRLTPEQNEKGLKFLKQKKIYDNDFGYREQHVIDDFKEFKLKGFKDDANSFQNNLGLHNYIPVYLAVANDGNTFEYYYNHGKVSVTG